MTIFSRDAVFYNYEAEQIIIITLEETFYCFGISPLDCNTGI